MWLTDFLFWGLHGNVFPMSVRMRHTRGHTGNRRSHHALAGVSVIKDKESGALRLPHRLDETTGMYRGKQIAAPRAPKVHTPKTKAASVEPTGEHAHEHEHAEHVHANAEVKAAKGVAGKAGGRPKARSGMGGGA